MQSCQKTEKSSVYTDLYTSQKHHSIPTMLSTNLALFTATAMTLMSNVLPVLSFACPSALVHLGIGASSGAAGAVIAYPLDLVKSQLQTENGRAKYGTDGIGAALDIVRSSPLGPLGLYRGCLVQIAGIAPEKTIKLTVNNSMRMLIMAKVGFLPIVGEVVAGGIAGFCQVIVTNPLEVVKLKLQTSGGDYSLKDVMEEVGGLLGMYKGVLPCIARDVTFSAILFPTFEHLKVFLPSILGSTFGHEIDPMLSSLMAGSIAAVPAAFIGTPFDVVKTRLQQARDNNEVQNGAYAEDMETENDFDLMKTVQTEGAHVLFSGWSERCARSCVQFGVTLSLFEVLNTSASDLGLL